MASDFLGVASDLDRQTSTDYLGAEAPVAFANQPAIEVASGASPLAGTGPTGVQEGGSTATSGAAALRTMLANPEAFFAGLDESPGGGDAGDSSGAVDSGVTGAGPAGIPTGSFGDVTGALGVPGGQLSGNIASVVAALLGVPSSVPGVIGAAVPGVSAALGPAGLGLAGFNGMIAVANALADAFGVPSNATIAANNNADETAIPGGESQASIDASLSAAVSAAIAALNNGDLATFGSIVSSIPGVARVAQQANPHLNLAFRSPNTITGYAGPPVPDPESDFGQVAPTGPDTFGFNDAPPAGPVAPADQPSEGFTTGGSAGAGAGNTGEDGTASAPGSDTGGAGPW